MKDYYLLNTSTVLVIIGLLFLFCIISCIQSLLLHYTNKNNRILGKKVRLKDKEIISLKTKISLMQLEFSRRDIKYEEVDKDG